MSAALHISRPNLAAVAGAVLAFAVATGPVAARDFIHTCVANLGNEETATVVFHPRLFGVDGNEGDGDVFTDDYEHRFHFSFRVTDYDPKKPGWTGPTRCKGSADWARDWDIPNVRPEFVTQNPGGIIYIKNVPRHSKVSLNFWAAEEDDGQDDILDFDPAPNRADLVLTVLVNQMQARTMVGARKGQNDVTLNKAKRVVGDGNIGSGRDHVRAFVEFVTNVHPDKKWRSDPVMGKVKQIPGSALQPKGKPTPDQRPECRDYALKSVQQNQQQLALGCGFAPPVWSNDHQMHFDWCVQSNNAKLIKAETQKRDAQLASCKQAKAKATQALAATCKQYAATAMMMISQAKKVNCQSLAGPRWLNDYNAHYNWCMTGVPKNLLQSENNARISELAACTNSGKK